MWILTPPSGRTSLVTLGAEQGIGGAVIWDVGTHEAQGKRDGQANEQRYTREEANDRPGLARAASVGVGVRTEDCHQR